MHDVTNVPSDVDRSIPKLIMGRLRVRARADLAGAGRIWPVRAENLVHVTRPGGIR